MKRKIDDSIVEIDITDINLLIKDYSRIVKELLSLKLYENNIFSVSNIIGEYAEIVVCDKMKLIQESPSNKDFDAVDCEGVKYQIKSRWMNSFNSNKGKNEFGSFSLDSEFDKLILVIFDDNINFNIWCVDKKDINNLLNLPRNEKIAYRKKDKVIIRFDEVKFRKCKYIEKV